MLFIQNHVYLIEMKTYNIKQQFIKTLTKINFLRPYEMYFYISLEFFCS